jgi:hypothetical protein
MFIPMIARATKGKTDPTVARVFLEKAWEELRKEQGSIPCHGFFMVTQIDSM